ncbi:MAG: 23S rRNA (pseudouridine(1915)-N(3))-methyltransferase RlmH [Planctomycetes bacterium]|nr:23S rRNA (pseudouridine(1915)-N(3))-methyltransferase RlmH [Planctomycetota bacterium]
MRLHLLAVGTRRPQWEVAGFEEYARRLSGDCTLRLVEIPAARRSAKGDARRWMEEEGQRMLAAIPAGAGVTVLDERGRGWSTRELSTRLQAWLGEGRDRALLIGGADGLSEACRARRGQSWRASRRARPHGPVRALSFKALYRAWSVLHNHPYHRA